MAVIDEIQMVPDLLNEIHWMIENTDVSFMMTGSSTRKLRRGHANLLAGRARRYIMTPLSYMETEGFDLEMELKAYQAYRNPELDIRFWRTSTGFEVDFILGDMNVAIEAKGSSKVPSTHTRGLRALLEEDGVKKGHYCCLGETSPDA